jgi:hypothetical protein
MYCARVSIRIDVGPGSGVGDVQANTVEVDEPAPPSACAVPDEPEDEPPLLVPPFDPEFDPMGASFCVPPVLPAPPIAPVQAAKHAINQGLAMVHAATVLPCLVMIYLAIGDSQSNSWGRARPRIMKSSKLALSAVSTARLDARDAGGRRRIRTMAEYSA